MKCANCKKVIDLNSKYVIIVEPPDGSWLHWQCMIDRIIETIDKVNKKHNEQQQFHYIPGTSGRDN